MVQMGLVQTDVPGAAHIAGAHRSRDGALYPGASGVLGLELGRSLAFTSPLQSLVVLPGPPDANGPPLVVLDRADAQIPARAGHAVLARELYLHHLGVLPVYGRRPAYALLVLRAGRHLIVPVDGERRSLKAGLFAGLPLVVRACWSVEIDSVVLLALRQKLGIQVAGVYELSLGEQISPF